MYRLFKGSNWLHVVVHFQIKINFTENVTAVAVPLPLVELPLRGYATCSKVKWGQTDFMIIYSLCPSPALDLPDVGPIIAVLCCLEAPFRFNMVFLASGRRDRGHALHC